MTTPEKPNVNEQPDWDALEAKFKEAIKWHESQQRTAQGELKNPLMQHIRSETPQSIIKKMDLKEKIQQESAKRYLDDKQYDVHGYEAFTAGANFLLPENTRLREALEKTQALLKKYKDAGVSSFTPSISEWNQLMYDIDKALNQTEE